MSTLVRSALRNTLITATYLSGFTAIPNFMRRWKQIPMTRILCFHKILDVESFERRIETLSRHYNWVSLDDFKAGRLSAQQINLCLTFDDGYLSWLRIIPFLERSQIPATFFLSSGFVNCEGRTEWENFCHTHLLLQNAEPNLRWNDATSLAHHSLFEIGGHTCNHRNLGELQDSEKLWQEIALDKEIIEERIAKKIKYFAYPFGHTASLSTLAANVVSQAGYCLALTLVPGCNLPSNDNLFLKRDCLDNVHSELLMRAWIEGGYDFWKSLQVGIEAAESKVTSKFQ